MTDRERRRFWRRVEQAENGCWKWVGGTRANGYGSFAVRPNGTWTQTTAHRWAFVDTGGVIPEGYEVDHLCGNRACVRPDHLEAVTIAENRRRRDLGNVMPYPTDTRALPSIPDPPQPPSKRNPETHCRNGHAYTEVGKVKNGNGMTCAECRRIQYEAKRKGGRHGTETHCPQGHPYSGDNLYVKPNGTRECRICIRERNRAAYAKRRFENMGDAPKHGQQTHCKRGHEFTPENTHMNTRGARECRPCQRLRAAERKAKSA